MIGFFSGLPSRGHRGRGAAAVRRGAPGKVSGLAVFGLSAALAIAAPAAVRADPAAKAPEQTPAPAAGPEAGPPHDAANLLDLSPEQLFGATVTSVNKTPGTVWNSAAAITVLSNEDIRRSGATSIPEALRMVPGVQVARVDGGGWAIGIRGFNGTLDNKLLVLMDGRELYNHLFSGTYWDVQDTPLEDIERIEVIRGPGAALWGANAVNGVINIITKSAADTQGGLVSAGLGNQDRSIDTTRYGGKIGDDGYYRVYAKFDERAQETTPAGGEAHDGQTAWHEGFRADWSPHGTGDSVMLQGDTYRDFDSDLRATPNLTPPAFSSALLDQTAADGGNLLARWTRSFADGAQFQLQTYLDYTLRSDLVIEDRNTAFDTEAQYTFAPTERNKLLAGLRYRLSSDDITGSQIATTLVPHLTDQLFSGFLQDQIALVPDRWILTLGTKIEHNNYTEVEVEPDVRLQWHPDPTHMFWAAASRAARTPSRLEHDVNVFAGVVAPFGPAFPVQLRLGPSPDFDSETLDAYQLGYRQQLSPAATLDLTAFYNVYDGLETVTLGKPDFALFPIITLPLAYTNDTTATTHGVEAALDWQVRKDLKFTASQSFLDLHLNGPPPSVAIAATAAAGQSPQSQSNLTAQWDVTDRLQFDSMLNYTSALPSLEVKSYWRLDERLGWKVSEGVDASVVGQNLLEAHHREFTSITDPGATDIGRSFFGKITWRF